MKISIIVAVSQNGVIGKNNAIPWYLPEDLKHFKKITTGHHILMGRKTYESIGKALPERTSLVITSNRDFEAPGCFTFPDINSAIEFAKKRNETELFVIGGAQIYKLAMPLAEKIYLTKIYKEVDGDIMFPKIDEGEWKEISNEKHLENDPPYEFIELIK